MSDMNASLSTPVDAATETRPQARLGMLTPSSNTVLEPVCQSMLAGLPLSTHFARFRVTEIALSAAANRQFSRDGMLHAAELLADAKVDAICWNGTSASWLGLDNDRALCAAIVATTGRPASTSVLAMLELLRLLGSRTVALVSPYTTAVQERIVATLSREGFELVAESHLGLSENYAFGAVAEPEIEASIRAVAAARPDAVLVMCTNLRAAPLAARLEQELGVVILDSVATAVWGGMKAAGLDPALVRGWGRMFQAAESSHPSLTS
jgi:maleate isomerase